MKRFMVKLHGKNFLLNFDGEPKKFGFHATKFVKAETQQEARKIATILVHQHPVFRETLMNESADRPEISSEEIKEVNFIKFLIKKSAKDFVFYAEDEE